MGLFVVPRTHTGLKRLKTYIRFSMRNDRLSAVGLIHIHRDFEVNLGKAMVIFVAAKNGGQILKIPDVFL